VTRPNDRGGAAVEIVLVAPLLIAMFLFVVGLGRLASSREAVDGAARDGAREASVARTVGRARAAADQIVRDTLRQRDVTCRGLVVQVDTSSFRPGGTVAVDVSCDVDNADVVLSGLPGRATLHGAFVAPVDTFRGQAP
jgi:Flp pilus assembly protein TadG